ncbi:MAG: HEAT repeat domain-containing protein [bacterium]|nr:HEAT repeat domain-containing protein [bacterium]
MRIKYLFLLISVAIILIAAASACKPRNNENKNPFGDQQLPADVPGLIALLKEPIQASANEITSSLVAKGVEAVPPLIEMLKEQDDGVRIRAVHALSMIGTSAIPDLITALDSDDYNTRIGSEDTLEALGHDASASVDKLMEVFASTTMPEQKNIMHALVKITDDPLVIGMIHAALRVDDLRFDALAVLGEWGPLAAETVPGILPYLVANASSARIATIQTLTAIGPVEGVVDGIAGRLQDPDLTVRDEAARSLGKLGAPAASATGALLDALNAETEDIRRTMIHALGLMAPDSRQAIEPLIGWLAYEDPQVRRETAWVLGQFGSEASGALPALQNLADTDQFPYVKLEAQHSIGLIEGNIPETTEENSSVATGENITE